MTKEIIKIDYSTFENGVSISEITTIFNGDYFAACGFTNDAMKKELICMKNGSTFIKDESQPMNKTVTFVEANLKTGTITHINH